MNILYTAVFNKYDTLEELDKSMILPGWEYKCFSDRSKNYFKSKTWDVIKIPKIDKIWRKVKLLPHFYLPEHEYSVWIDANITPHVNLNEFVAGKKFLIMKHPHRDNIYDEAQACIQLGKDKEEIIRAQIEAYGRGIPGLVASGVMVRKDCKEVRKLDWAWWNEVLWKSIRDQLSFNYVAHKLNFEYETFPFLEGFTIRPHVCQEQK